MATETVQKIPPSKTGRSGLVYPNQGVKIIEIEVNGEKFLTNNKLNSIKIGGISYQAICSIPKRFGEPKKIFIKEGTKYIPIEEHSNKKIKEFFDGMNTSGKLLETYKFRDRIIKDIEEEFKENLEGKL